MNDLPRLSADSTAVSVLLDGGSRSDSTEAALEGALRQRSAAGRSPDVVRERQPSTIGSIEAQLARLAGALLHVDIADALLAGWQRHAEILGAAERTASDPGSKEVVELSKHRISFKRSPRVALRIDGHLVHTYTFDLEIGLEVVEAAAALSSGSLVSVETGPCTALVMLCLDQQLLAEPRQALSPNLRIILDPPLRLVSTPVQPSR